MTGGRRADVACRADLYRLHIHRFARGTYPESCGHTDSMPVNRCFMPLSNPSGAECYLEDDTTHFTVTPGNAYFIPLNYPVRLRLDEYEWGILMNSLMEMRNGLVAARKDADPLNDLLLKIIRSKKRFSLFGRWC